METADREQRTVSLGGVTVEQAFERLGSGDVAGHNDLVADAIRSALAREPFQTVMLAQLSMSVFKLSHPNCEESFGVEVLTSGEEGFKRIRSVLEQATGGSPAM